MRSNYTTDWYESDQEDGSKWFVWCDIDLELGDYEINEFKAELNDAEDKLIKVVSWAEFPEEEKDKLIEHALEQCEDDFLFNIDRDGICNWDGVELL